MKHIFTLLAAVSLLICLALAVLTAATFTSSKTFALGERGERSYSFVSDSLEFTYQGRIAPFDMSRKDEYMGIEYVTLRRANATGVEATGFVLVVPALYPIALFAILPLVWVVGAIRRKKGPALNETTASGPPPVSRV